MTPVANYLGKIVAADVEQLGSRGAAGAGAPGDGRPGGVRRGGAAAGSPSRARGDGPPRPGAGGGRHRLTPAARRRRQRLSPLEHLVR